MTPAEILALVAFLSWLGLALDRGRSWPSQRLLPPQPTPDPTGHEETVVAIVPARNEAEMLVETLSTLLVQGGSLKTILLVDDDSDDETAAVGRELGDRVATDVRLEVLQTTRRQLGWSGKVHAQNCAYQHVLQAIAQRAMQPPDWLLLSDADIRHRPDSVAALLEQASVGQGYGLVSVMARLRAETFWERLLIPTFVFFFQLLYPFSRIASPTSRVAAAAGGCVLIRWQELVALGGFAAIGREIIDDVALGKAVKARGTRIWLGLDPEIVSIRPYRRLQDLWQMVSRTAFTQLGHNALLLVLTLAALLLLVVSPPILIGWGLFELAGADTAALPTVIRTITWATLAWALMTVALYPSVRHHRAPAGFAISLPVGGLLFGLMTVTSAWNHWFGSGATWRGRSFRGAG